MDIGLVGLLERGMPGSFLKQLWCPPLFCQSREHRMAKNVWGDCNARARSESSKERVYIRIGKRLACLLSMLIEEQMVGFELSGECKPHVGDNLVDEIF